MTKSRKESLTLLFLLLLICILVSAFKISSVRSTPSTIRVPQDYPTIQEAIDHAADGDTILVSPGIYEGFTFKAYTNNITVLGLNRGRTIINSSINFQSNSGTSTPHKIVNCTIKNGGVFVVGDWGVGGYVVNNTILNCGVTIGGGKGACKVIIRNNVIKNNSIGIYWAQRGIGEHVVIVNNTVINSSITGIHVESSSDGGLCNFVTISGNNISCNNAGIHIKGTTIIGNVTENLISFNKDYGIWLESINNTVVENEITNNNCGIKVSYYYTHVFIFNNTIANNNLDGVHVYDVDLLITTGNIFWNNRNGIRIYLGSEGDNIYQVNFNDIFGNEYWNLISDYTGPPRPEPVINATYNWWGTTNQTLIEQGISGNVTFIPYLWNSISSEDFLPPSIQNITLSPSTPSYHVDVNVTARVKDNVNVDSVILSYKTSDGWNNATMEENEGIFQGTIPKQPFNTTVYYRIFARDNSSNWGITSTMSYIVNDTVPPLIETIWIPEYPYEGRYVTILANITEPPEASGVADIVKFAYRINGGEWWNTSMSYNSTTGYWTVTIPPYPKGSIINFTITTWDLMGNKNTTAYGYKVLIAGDVTGPEGTPDGKVNMRDIGAISRRFGTQIGDPEYVTNYDITGPTENVPDGKINMRDIGLASRHFGETDP